MIVFPRKLFNYLRKRTDRLSFERNFFDPFFYERKIVIIFLPINLNMCLSAEKNRLIETVLLSTHNICFG